MKKISLLALLILSSWGISLYACTVIAVGKNASVDGSVIISHTDAGPDNRIRHIPAQTFPDGAKAPVYWGLTEINGDLDNYGEIIGYIPQVKKTYAYFHSEYSQS